MSARLFFGALPVVAMGFIATASAPVTTRYRIESKNEQVIDLSAFGQGTQNSTFLQVAIVSVTLNDSAGGKVMHVVVDSIFTDAPLPGAAEAAQKAKGSWVHATVDGWNRATVVKSSDESNDIVAQIKNSVVRLFPVVKPGSKQGDTWTDTATVDSKSTSQATKTTTIRTYTRAGTEQRNGETAVKIQATTTMTGSGTIENPMAGSMDIELADNATETYFITVDGRYLGGETKSTGKNLVRTPQAPEPIPVKLTRSTTISIVK